MRCAISRAPAKARTSPARGACGDFMARTTSDSTASPNWSCRRLSAAFAHRCASALAAPRGRDVDGAAQVVPVFGAPPVADRVDPRDADQGGDLRTSVRPPSSQSSRACCRTEAS
jgi:hypothetical protein